MSLGDGFVDSSAPRTVRVRLEDTRGVWRYARSNGPLPKAGDVIRLQGQAWQGLPFVLTSRIDVNGVPIARCAVPLIGPLTKPYHPLYKPAGWHAPEGAPRSLAEWRKRRDGNADASD